MCMCALSLRGALPHVMATALNVWIKNLFNYAKLASNQDSYSVTNME